MLILFWLYKSRINKSGQAPIMMRITCDGKRISFSISLFVEPKSWDQDKQKLKGNSPLPEELNNPCNLFYYEKEKK
jgi:integrase/recombinase XerD